MRIREENGSAELPAVVFVHGAGVAGWMWKKQLEALGKAGRWRLVAVDLDDHGTQRDRPFPGIEQEADELCDLIQGTALGGKAWLVGHSLGARIVLEALVRRPETVLGAVVSSALVRPSPLVSMMDSHALNAMSLWMLRSKAIARLQAREFAFPDASMTEDFLADVAAMETGNLDRPVAAFAGRLVPPPGLDRVACPVLVTVGSREPASMRKSAEDLTSLIPGACLAGMVGARHNYPWAGHEAYSALVRDLLEGRVAGKGAL